MKKLKGFTLAEVLITLAIIGIVAAITLPSLLVNVNEKAWDAQKKALHARMAQAIGQMNMLDGYGTYMEDEEGAVTEDTAAESFILDALSKVYKINNVCGAGKLSACGVPSKIATLGGEAEISFPMKMSDLNATLFNGYKYDSEDGGIVDTKAAAFETVNGESVAVFYNPKCGSNSSINHHVQNRLCVNFVYDLNGNDAPNEVGKDIGFIMVLYRKNSSVVAPMPYFVDSSTAAPSYTDSSDLSDAANVCKMQGEDLRLPNIDEMAGVFVNATLLNFDAEKYGYWSSSIVSTGSNGLAWSMAYTGRRYQDKRNLQYKVRCIYK